MGKHRVIPCTPPADPDALLVDDATAREHIDTLRDVTTEIARTVAGLDGRATPADVQQARRGPRRRGAAVAGPETRRAPADDLERALRSADDQRRAARRGDSDVDLDALLETMPEGVVGATPPPPAPPLPRGEPEPPSTPPRRRRFSLSRMFGDAYRRGAGVR